MSAGVRLPLEWGLAAAAELFRRWQMSPSTCQLCGSIRRRCAEIGDLDIIAPLPEARFPDELHASIDRTVIADAAAPGLFIEQTAPKFTEVVSGHRPYFKSLSVVCHLEAEGRNYAIPVQVNRYVPENRGWMEIYKTGPRDFGVWFLVKWKERFGIPISQQASIGNLLRDANGTVVPVRSEREAFAACGLAEIRPEDREEVARRAMAGWSQEQRERVS